MVFLNIKILLSLVIILAVSNCLYFELKRGESKCFNYDLTKRSVYIGEYWLLDAIPNIEATGDGIRVNFHEPNSKNYYTKVFQTKDRQVFNAKVPGVHKVCFEGTKNLFVSTNSVRVSVKMHDEAKHDKTIERALKEDDLKDVRDKVFNIQSTMAEVSQYLMEGDNKANEFEKLQSSYNSRAVWLSILAMLAVIASAGVEAYIFKRSMLKGNGSKIR